MLVLFHVNPFPCWNFLIVLIFWGGNLSLRPLFSHKMCFCLLIWHGNEGIHLGCGHWDMWEVKTKGRSGIPGWDWRWHCHFLVLGKDGALHCKETGGEGEPSVIHGKVGKFWDCFCAVERFNAGICWCSQEQGKGSAPGKVCPSLSKFDVGGWDQHRFLLSSGRIPTGISGLEPFIGVEKWRWGSRWSGSSWCGGSQPGSQIHTTLITRSPVASQCSIIIAD